MQRIEVFHRQELLNRFAAEIMSSEGSSGLFVTAPRRTGKSTFIREDLIPTLSKLYDTQIVYADLWEDRATNPGLVIVEAIKSELLKFDGFSLRAAKGVGLDKIKVGGLEMSLENIGFGKGETLAKALTLLAAASKKSITLIIDEAQHSQVSDEGRQALYALKAARDALNASNGPGFRLLATGSSSDKLASLVEDKDQAFYQAPLVELPTLGLDYLTWYRNGQYFEPKPSVEAMERGFDACSHRPEPLRKVFQALRLTVGLSEETVDAHFLKKMDEALANAKANFMQQVNGLEPLDAAVLKVMAMDGKKFVPYSKISNINYQAFVLASTGSPAGEVTQSAIQLSLERLRNEKFVWKAGRGAYLIEDTQHTAWILEAVEQERDELDRAKREVQALAAAAIVPKSDGTGSDAKP